MLKNIVNTITGAATGVIGSLTGGGSADREEAAARAAETRKRNAAQRSETARKAAATRQANAQRRSATAKKSARTRAQRDARAGAMVEDMKEQAER
jgi:hypothetical protein